MAETIGVASDHGGKLLKERVKDFLRKQGFEVKDFGVPAEQSGSVDYPDYAAQLAEAISRGELKRGVAICGTGIGMCIAANKIPNVRAASIWDDYTAKVSRQHNDANIACLGERVLNPDRAMDYLTVWLNTPFEGGRHAQRVDKIKNIEKRHCKGS